MLACLNLITSANEDYVLQLNIAENLCSREQSTERKRRTILGTMTLCSVLKLLYLLLASLNVETYNSYFAFMLCQSNCQVLGLTNSTLIIQNLIA
jgi:hypothetical protein